jgi:hypothetical protein
MDSKSNDQSYFLVLFSNPILMAINVKVTLRSEKQIQPIPLKKSLKHALENLESYRTTNTEGQRFSNNLTSCHQFIVKRTFRAARMTREHLNFLGLRPSRRSKV